MRCTTRRASGAVVVYWALLLSYMNPAAVADPPPPVEHASAQTTDANSATREPTLRRAVDAPEAFSVPQPQLHVGEPVFDFGRVEQGETVTHVFHFSNRGERNLRVESVETSCGCTAAVLAADTIPPGESGSIQASLDTSRFLGRQSKRLHVRTNDPVRPVTPLVMQGEITTEVQVQPAQLYLGRLRRGSPTVRTLSVLFDADKPIEITQVRHDNPAIRVEAEDVQLDGKRGKRLRVSVAKTAVLGRLDSTLTITTTSAKKPILNVPVFGSVEGDVTVEPPQVSFGIVNPANIKTRSVRIVNHAATPLRIVEVTSSLEAVVPELNEVTPGREFRLRLRADGTRHTGKLRGSIQVMTDHPEQPRLTIPVFGAVNAARQAGR